MERPKGLAWISCRQLGNMELMCSCDSRTDLVFYIAVALDEAAVKPFSRLLTSNV